MNRTSLAILALLLSLITTLSVGQRSVVKTETGQTEFFSKAAGPAQDISAIDKTGSVRLDLATGQVQIKINMKNFALPRPLMQKHYNERYIQTDKFPFATFEGTVANWQSILPNASAEVVASGNFTVHGVTKKRSIKGKLTKKGDSYLLYAQFEVKLSDHEIEIPVLFFTRITEKVTVTATYNLTP
jgi:polyisoprenoid-binding protein YceI